MPLLPVGGAGGNGALIAISVAHGLGILTAVAWTANISGGHIKPAVTLAMAVTNKIKPVPGMIIQDVPVKHCTVRVYRPESQTSGAGLLWIHGGVSWRGAGVEMPVDRL